jgi:bifunctional non-homologous end joining protein LigD
LVCEVKFSEWTNDKRMRHPTFTGLRPELRPEDCRFETERATEDEIIMQAKEGTSQGDAQTDEKVLPASVLTSRKLRGNVRINAGGKVVALSHLDKVYWPDDGYTKQDLLAYYLQVSKYLLPYLKDRPLILKRYPNGIGTEPFHQHTVKSPPDYVDTYTRDKEGGSVVHALANHLAALLYVVNLGTITQHPWSSRITNPEKPDWIIFDIDPGEAHFDHVREATLAVKDLLDEVGLESYLKTSGSRGLHVYVPVKPLYDYEQVVPFASLLATIVARRHPHIATVERMVRNRKKGLVYLDYLQNGQGKSVASVYSVRARPGATVSTPLEWSELKAGKVTPRDFNIKNLVQRLEKKGDLFKGVLTKKQTINKAVTKLSKLV